MKKFILITYLIILSISTNAQLKNNAWCFGDSARIDFSNGAMAKQSSVNARGSATSVCDSNGNILFYACTKGNNWNTGGRIFDATDYLMQGGDSIYGESWYHELTIVPKPGSNHIYYLFSIGIVFSTPGFYYSLIDMSLNGGLGAVTQKNVQLNSFRNADCVTAIKHGNGRDWWVISKIYNSSSNIDSFLVYFVTKDSIYLPIINSFPIVANAGLLRLSANGNGTKIMHLQSDGFMCEYDFNRCTGIMNNQKKIFPAILGNSSRLFWSGDYSSDNSKFYCSTTFYTFQDTSYLIQYDLTATNIPASADTLGKVTWPVQGGAVRLAPDNKIYYSCFYDWGFPGYPYPDSVHNMYNENLGVINFPDSLGAACDYQPFSFYLGGKRTYYGLPNNPNYELGPLVGSPCDTLSAATPKPPHEDFNTGVLQCTYISSLSKVFINASGVKGKDVTVSIYDARGSLKFEVKSLKNNAGYVTVDVDCGAVGSPSGAGGAGWSNGIFIVNLQSEKESLSCKFVKQ